MPEDGTKNMANKQQAIKWLLEGKKIRRLQWDSKEYIYFDKENLDFKDERGNYYGIGFDSDFEKQYTGWELFNPLPIDFDKIDKFLQENGFEKTDARTYMTEKKMKNVTARIGFKHFYKKK